MQGQAVQLVTALTGSWIVSTSYSLSIGSTSSVVEAAIGVELINDRNLEQKIWILRNLFQ